MIELNFLELNCLEKAAVHTSTRERSKEMFSIARQRIPITTKYELVSHKMWFIHAVGFIFGTTNLSHK